MPPSRPTLTGASGNPRPILLYGFECSVSSDDDEEKGVHAHEGSGADTDEDYYYEEEEASNMVRYSERLEQDAHVNEDRPNSPVSPRRRRGMQDDEDAASAWSSGACTPCSPERKRDFAGVEEEHAEVEHHGNNNNNNTNKSNTMPGVDCVEAVTPQQDKKQGEKRTATSLQDVIQAMKLSIQSPVVISPSACILMSADDIGTKQHSTPASSTTSHSNTNNGSKEDMTRPSAYVFKTSTPAAVTAYASDDDEEAPPILCEAAVYQSSANSPTPKHPSSHGHPPMIRPGLTTSLSVGGFSSTPTLSRGNSHDSVNSTAVVDTSLIRLELDPRLAAALSASTDSVLSSREEDAGSGVSSRKNSDEAGEIRREIRTAMPTGGAALESMIASQSADEQLAQNTAKARSWVTAHKSYLQVTLQEHRRSIVAVAAELYEEWWGRRYVLDRATGQFYFKEIAPATLSGAVPAPPPLPPPPPPAAAAGAAGPSTPRSAATAAQENWRLHRNVGDVVQPSTPSVVVDSPLSPLQILAECRVSRRSVNLIDPMAVQLVTGPCSGTEALFRLSPTLPVAKQTELLSAFVDDQLEMYDRQVHHLMFDVLYTRIVAIPATLMLERHERRLLCMRRDLYLRDAIDLFMLTAPKRVQLSPIEIDIQNIKSRLHSWLRDSPKPSSHTAVIHPRGGSTIERAESFEQYNWTSRRSYLDNAYTTMPPGGITVSCVEKGKRSSVVMKAEIISPVTPTPAASHFFNTEDAIRDGASQGKREEHQVRISSFTQGGGVGGSRSSSDGNVLTSTVTVHAAVRRSPAITTRVSGSVLPAIHSRPQRPTVMRATERHGIKPASHQMARKRRQGHVSEDQFDSIEALRTPVL